MAYVRVWSFALVYDDFNWLWPLKIGIGRQALAFAPFRFASWIGGGAPWAYHGLVLSLHVLNGFLLWAVMRRWLSRSAAVLALTLFWLHPLQVESVAYVSGGIEVLLTTYVLLAWLTSRGSHAWRMVTLICLGLGASLKPSALPILMLVPLAFAVTRRVALWPRVVALTVLAGVFGASTVTGFVRAAPLVMRLHDLLTLATAVCRYLAFVVVPVGFSIEHDWSVPLIVGVAAVWALISAGVVAYRRRQAWPAPWFAWLWIVGLLAPRLIAPSAPTLTEHHTYLPFLAIWLLFGASLDRLRTHAPVWSVARA